MFVCVLARVFVMHHSRNYFLSHSYVILKTFKEENPIMTNIMVIMVQKRVRKKIKLIDRNVVPLVGKQCNHSNVTCKQTN